jgi:hypothetical protein
VDLIYKSKQVILVVVRKTGNGMIQERESVFSTGTAKFTMIKGASASCLEIRIQPPSETSSTSLKRSVTFLVAMDGAAGSKPTARNA